MADPESVRQSVESPAPFSAWLGVVLLFSLFGVIVFAVIGPAPRGDTYEQLRAQKRVEKLKVLRESDAKQLTAYSWIDKNKGVVGLPIDRAMQLTVAELAAKTPTAAYPIATPAPEASAVPAAASPGPGASPTSGGTPKPVLAAASPPPSGTQPPASASLAVSPAPGTETPQPTASPAKIP